MGGIKKLLQQLKSLSLTERADDRRSSGEVKADGMQLLSQSKSFPMAGKVPSPARQMRGHFISPRLGRRQSQTDREVVSLFKYIGLACLAIALISTITLNLLSTTSSPSQAETAMPVTLASSSEPHISLSITSATDSCNHTTSSSASSGDICIGIPAAGGVAVGSHRVSVVTNAYYGYEVTLNNQDDSVGLSSNKDSNYPSSNEHPAEMIDASFSSPKVLANKKWGYAAPSAPSSKFASISNYQSTNQTTLKNNTTWARTPEKSKPGDVVMGSSHATANGGTASDTSSIYWGVRVDDPATSPAGTYKEWVTYTATAKLPAAPTVTKVEPSTYEIGSGGDGKVTITGTNLLTTYDAYVDLNGNGQKDNGEECSNLAVASETQISCNIPTNVTSTTKANVRVVTQGGTSTVNTNVAVEYVDQPYNTVSVDYGSDGHVQVDWDKNMIPVKYTGGTSSPQWTAIPKATIASNPSIWFNYTEKTWANAVTVKDPSKYNSITKDTVVDSNDVLGYWVYIPRYAYEVQRRDATDKYVNPQNFDIMLETTDDSKKIPAASCSYQLGSSVNSRDYRTQCNISRAYGNTTGTTWATHPAFSWLDNSGKGDELNGFWIGKFETTGKITAPTVKPNQHANILQTVGEFYTSIKNIGIDDPNNIGGSPVSGVAQNSHHLNKTTSHMLKNSEWGAVTYLAHSKFGAGINDSYTRKTNVNKNGTYVSGNDADGDSSYYGITGCGPINANSTGYYSDGTQLNAATIESPTACSVDVQYAYNGNIGRLASTTNNVYGVYDMSGGADEYVMGNVTSYSDHSYAATDYLQAAIKPPFVNLYKTSDGFNSQPSWSISSTEEYYNVDVCTFETCGGTATYETTVAQSIDDNQSWGGSQSEFATLTFPWFRRGGASDNYLSSIFDFHNYYGGYANYTTGTRAALLVDPRP